MATSADIQKALAKSVTALSRTLADQKTRIERLDTALTGEQAAYTELQGRLSVLTSLVVSVGNTVGMVIHALQVALLAEEPPDEQAVTLTALAQGLAHDVTGAMTQMGVDPEVLLDATGVVLEPEKPVRKPDGYHCPKCDKLLATYHNPDLGQMLICGDCMEEWPNPLVGEPHGKPDAPT